MKIKMYMKVTRDEYQLPIYYAENIRDLSLMCGISRSKIETAIKGPKNKYKPKEFIMVTFSDHDNS